MFPVAVYESLHTDVDMVMQCPLDGPGIPVGRYHGEVPAHDEVPIMFLGRGLADLQVSENALEFIGFGDIVVVFEHGEYQALAEATRAEKKEVLAGFFQGGDVIGTIGVEIAFRDQGVKVGNAVGEFHDSSAP